MVKCGFLFDVRTEFSNIFLSELRLQRANSEHETIKLSYTIHDTYCEHLEGIVCHGMGVSVYVLV
jgi:hypothetical protein